MLSETTRTQEASLDDLFTDIDLSHFGAVNACLHPGQSGICDELVYIPE
ncbi:MULTISPECIES: hypothetical protein [Streptomyces]|uniref:Uncharacterized protein n=1 Tax=Streptomyces lycii TaxID=2654337 RepID=A0ABQ7FI30_9ACTN|nr:MULTISPECIES: hypothetical protein [Streptomyces]KAF4406913.1 hypothetical protein GCU69_22330 [Streptomyces lycii]